MPDSSPAISIRGLGKSYTIQNERDRPVTLAETCLQRLRSPFKRASRETFWALSDIDLDIDQGEVVGIIGRNGAGKSTLLKVLSRITEPTRGHADLYGRVGSLLEVGTGFHPELTGRENIYLNGSILGMRRSEIRDQFDDIVDFAGVSKFLDTPVKRYSSGMYVRLAFAVAAHLQSEILLVDEVLAVGDAEFQARCLGKMRDVAKSGRTVLFVSHHIHSVEVLCDRALFLHRGRVEHFGAVGTAIGHYLRSYRDDQAVGSDATRRPGTGQMRFGKVETDKPSYSCGEPKTIRFSIDRVSDYEYPVYVEVEIVGPQGGKLLQCDSRLVNHWIHVDQHYEGEITIRSPWLKPGEHHVNLYLQNEDRLDYYENACSIHVDPLLPYPAPANAQAIMNGVVFADFAYRKAGTNEGVAAAPARPLERATRR